jgi:subtilisin-like proprotein convertase family protein
VNHDSFEKHNRSLGASMSRRDFGRVASCGGFGALISVAFGALDADARKKRDKKKGKKRKTRAVTRTLRGSITQSFTSSGPIIVPSAIKGPANPYPSAIVVSGLPNGVITDVDVLLLDFTHRIPEDVDILLRAPDGRRAFVMSDVGSTTAVAKINLTLDDEADTALPESSLDSGVFRPTDLDQAVADLDTFDAPAPAPDGSVALSTFDGANPNGTWRLFVMDDTTGDAGAIGSWALRITAEVDTGTVDERVPTGKDAKKRKRRH